MAARWRALSKICAIPPAKSAQLLRPRGTRRAAARRDGRRCGAPAVGRPSAPGDLRLAGSADEPRRSGDLCRADRGSWPGAPSPDPLLPPAVLRHLGVPGADFRIGLAAHDLAGAMGAPEVVLSWARRDEAGPVIPSRFVLRVAAMLGSDLADKHRETDAQMLGRGIEDASPAPAYPRPQPRPSAEQRQVDISATGLDRLRSDPYQFYASAILRLSALDGLDAEPSAALKGSAVHDILDQWHNVGGGAGATARDCRRGTRRDERPPVDARAVAAPADGRAGLDRRRSCAAARLKTAARSLRPSARATCCSTACASMAAPIASTGWPTAPSRIVDYKTGMPPSAQDGRGRLFAPTRHAGV